MPALSPARIVETAMGFRAAKTLLSAVELDLFTTLGDHAMTGEDLRVALRLHLRATPDFFDAREHPTARFVTKSVSPGAQPGEATISGDLTLHGVTKPVSFPAKVDVSDHGVTITGSFDLDRSEFGMDKLLDRVNKEVKVTVAVGQKTEKLPRAPGPR